MRCEATRAYSTIGLMSGTGRLRTPGVTLLVLAATVATLVTPAGGSIGRRDALPTRLPGTLTVAVDIGTIGLAEGTFTGGSVANASGFEIDLARALARKLGVKLRIIDVPFARVVTPGSKPFDVSVAHVTITAMRAKSVDFSPTYFVVNKGVLVAPGVVPPATLADHAKGGRHDPCIMPRAVPVLEAMVSLVLADLVLQLNARPHSA